MKRYTIEEAIELLKNKKGAGKVKPFRLYLDMDINMKTGPMGAVSLLETIKIILNTLILREPEFVHFTKKDIHIKDKSFVETELENNLDTNYNIPNAIDKKDNL